MPSGLYRRVKIAQSDFCRVDIKTLQSELDEISLLIPVDNKEPLTLWLKTEVAEMQVAISNRKRVSLKSEAPDVKDMPKA